MAMPMPRSSSAMPELDPREERFRLPSPHRGLSLFLRSLAPNRGVEPLRHPVLYVHGGTFPSALSIAHRFDGRSWRDALCDEGFHVWGLDFHGFGAVAKPRPPTAAIQIMLQSRTILRPSPVEVYVDAGVA